MRKAILQTAVGFLASNLTEWVFHKYVLHGLGKNKKSRWSFHWHGHHKMVRKQGMLDPDYINMSASSLLKTPEAISLLSGAASLLPIATKFPWFVGTVWLCGAAYYGIHYYAHINPKWAYRYIPWHVDHHLGNNQDANFNVTLPVFDYLLGTREVPAVKIGENNFAKRLYLEN